MLNVGFNSSPIFTSKIVKDNVEDKSCADCLVKPCSDEEYDKYIPSGKNEDSKPQMKQYIPEGATPQEVRDILADKKKAGRSFFGFKRSIKNMVKNSEDKDATIYNLNYLLNAEDKKLPAIEVNAILALTEQVNKGSKAFDRYGFKGGKLDDESYAKIKKQRENDFMFGLSALAVMNNQMTQSQMMMEQQMLFDQQNQLFQQQVQQDMFTHQQMINNQMMGF